MSRRLLSVAAVLLLLPLTTLAQTPRIVYLPLVAKPRPPAPPPPPPPVPLPGCDPAYPYVCIPSPPPDLDCVDISYRNFVVVGADPHKLDIDEDGIGCERS